MFSGLHNSRNWAWPDAGWVFRDQMAAIPAEEISDQAVLVRLPAVSVIMLAYNHAPWLEEAVESVMRQQLGEPFELLIGEDRSSDHTLDLALSLQRRWPERIRVIHAPTNVGMRDNVLRLLVRARALSDCLPRGRRPLGLRHETQTTARAVESRSAPSPASLESPRIAPRPCPRTLAKPVPRCQICCAAIPFTSRH